MPQEAADLPGLVLALHKCLVVLSTLIQFVPWYLPLASSEGCCLWFGVGINNFGVIETVIIEKIKSFSVIFFQSPYCISGQCGLNKCPSQPRAGGNPQRTLKPFLLFPALPWVIGTCELLAVFSFSSASQRKYGRKNMVTFTEFSPHMSEGHSYLFLEVSDL